MGLCLEFVLNTGLITKGFLFIAELCWNKSQACSPHPIMEKSGCAEDIGKGKQVTQGMFKTKRESWLGRH